MHNPALAALFVISSCCTLMFRTAWSRAGRWVTHRCERALLEDIWSYRWIFSRNPSFIIPNHVCRNKSLWIIYSLGYLDLPIIHQQFIDITYGFETWFLTNYQKILCSLSIWQFTTLRCCSHVIKFDFILLEARSDIRLLYQTSLSCKKNYTVLFTF